MRNMRRLVLTVAVSGLIAGCSSDNSGPSLPNIIGNWLATKFEFVSVANSSTKVDVVATNSPITMAITAAGFTIASQGQTVFSGTYTETATTLATIGTDSQGNQENLTFALALSGSTLSLTGGTTTHNFGSGQVPAYLNTTWTKQ